MLSDFFLAGMRSSTHCIWSPLSSFHKKCPHQDHDLYQRLTVLTLVAVSKQFEKLITLSFSFSDTMHFHFSSHLLRLKESPRHMGSNQGIWVFWKDQNVSFQNYFI